MNKFIYIKGVRACGNMKHTLVERMVAWSFLRYVGYVLTEDVLCDIVKDAAEKARRLKMEHPHCYDCFIHYRRPATLAIGRHSRVDIAVVKGITTDYQTLKP